MDASQIESIKTRALERFKHERPYLTHMDYELFTGDDSNLDSVVAWAFDAGTVWEEAQDAQEKLLLIEEIERLRGKLKQRSEHTPGVEYATALVDPENPELLKSPVMAKDLEDAESVKNYFNKHADTNMPCVIVVRTAGQEPSPWSKLDNTVTIPTT